MQLDVQAIDLALMEDDNRDEFVVMRLIDATGLVLDVPMARQQAEAFGESLRAYASAAHLPTWLPHAVSPAKARLMAFPITTKGLSAVG
ncbi:hypothetical protein Mycsm_02677 [Mycobacterium sp. JS623]|nr:hypothetical protein Mycsm_02677 [Mycobacterium sp. JS623]